MRIEQDSLGSKSLKDNTLYGIHTLRAIENFPIGKTTVNPHLIKGIIQVKQAAAMAHKLAKSYEPKKCDHIIAACSKLLEHYDDRHFPISAIQGGAGTSTNMNVNEVIANQALLLAGRKIGDYDYIHPLHHVNKSQSTNDVYPSALRIAAITLLRKVAEAFAGLQEAFQEKEQEFSDIIKLGRTQLMDALPIMLGQEFGAYAQAIARDRWRLYKIEERLRQINLGGTGIGTGLNAENTYIFAVTEYIRELTGIGLARAEFPIDLTQNQDVFVEVSGLLKSAAVNLIKIANDLRLMNSGPTGGLGEINLQPLQAGSSMMPGKVNPIIPEAVTSSCLKIIGLDSTITMAATMGQLELNAFVPTIAESLLEAIELMLDAVMLFREKCILTLTANKTRCYELLENSPALLTALSEHLSYEATVIIGKEALATGKTIPSLILEQGLLAPEKLDKILNPYALTKPGIPGK